MKVLLAGVDEAGRGPIAGPVYAAAVILPRAHGIAGLADSKRLTEAARDRLSAEIRAAAMAWAVARAEVEEIDRLNILQASLMAMARAVAGLGVEPDKVLVDGRHCPALSCATEAVVGGDDSVAEISAASILAKVSRDAEMRSLHERYPEYGFDRHKGYPTRAHLLALKAYGACAVHRRSFGPVAAQLGLF